MNALLIGTNSRFAEAVTYQFTKVGMECFAVPNPEAARLRAWLHRPDLLIVDAADVPAGQVETLTALRRETSAPMITLGGLSDESSTITAIRPCGRDLGAHGVSVPKLMRCVHHVLEGHTAQRLAAPAPLDLGDLQINPDRLEAWICGRRVHLSPTEMEIMYCLGIYANRVVSWETLLNCVWGCEFSPRTSVISRHMRGLREKIESCRDRPRYLIAKHGGYMLSTAAPHATDTRRTYQTHST